MQKLETDADEDFGKRMANIEDEKLKAEKEMNETIAEAEKKLLSDQSDCESKKQDYHVRPCIITFDFQLS